MKAPRLSFTMEKRRNLHGYVFILPWVIGVLIFFIMPMIEACVYIFNDVTTEVGRIDTVFTGLTNIKAVLFKDPGNIRMILSSIGTTLTECLLIVVFSLLIAAMLHRKLKSMSLAKALYALPLIVSSGIMLAVFKQDLFVQSSIQNSDSTIFQAAILNDALYQFGLNYQMVNTISSLVSQIMDIVWKSGVQILLFTAAWNSVPTLLYEVCKVEGATSWQIFWEVTFPMITPFILLNTIYSIIDAFTHFSNPVMEKIYDLISKSLFETSTTLSVAYCLCILVVIGVVGGIISRRVFYIEN